MMWRTSTFLLALILIGQTALSAAAPGTHQRLQPFLAAHCIDCHQGSDAEANLDFSTLSTDLADPETLRRWTHIHDRIASGEMPPAEMPRPTKAETSAALKSLAAALVKAARPLDDDRVRGPPGGRRRFLPTQVLRHARHS